MKIYRMELEGHLVEVRRGDLGGERVLVDGHVVSDRPLAGWSTGSHFFDLQDRDGELHRVEVRRRDTSRLGLGRYEMVVAVDGRERARLEPASDAAPEEKCPNCGYALTGLPVEAGEVCCPECGRHTAAVLLGRFEE